MARPIAIDARLNAYRLGGIAQYTRKLIEHLARLAPGESWLALEHRKATAPVCDHPSVARARLWTPPHHRFEQIALPAEIALRRPRLLHSPDFIPPLRRTCPAIITVHDLAFRLYPEILDDAARRFYGQIDRAVRSAEAILADSHSTAADITRLLGVPAERIDVIHLGTDVRPLTVAPGETRRLGGADWRAGEFITFISTLEPRKNIPTLLKALRVMIDRDPGAGYRLALAGSRGWLDDEIWACLRDQRLEDAVGFIEKPSDADVNWLLSACRVYVNPSRYEGFGLPALDALACGAPAVVSASSSLPEVVGDAAEQAPPDDVGAWADAIGRLWHDPDRRAELGRLGLRRAAEFTWERTAAQTLAV
ncbi:MAG TPA: glycosyltransferase family 1 protein, partial [Herpetosiphonaceae bacterium]|nr:glycosyltransferase family 1 protein [Herpetosiphonaceae bacterium]